MNKNTNVKTNEFRVAFWAAGFASLAFTVNAFIVKFKCQAQYRRKRRTVNALDFTACEKSVFLLIDQTDHGMFRDRINKPSRDVVQKLQILINANYNK